MTQKSPPTLDDVARMAGVSAATISRALNDPDKVAKATRDKIDLSIDALGYTPNFGGRLLASNRTNTMAAIIPTMSNAMFASGIQAFQEALSEDGISLLIATTGYDPEQELHHIRALMANGAEGFLLVGTARPQATKDFLLKRNVRHVIAWAIGDEPGQVYSGFDNRQAAYALAQRAVSLGHRRFGLIGGVAEGNDRARDRVQGVEGALAASGTGAQIVARSDAGYRIEYGAEAMQNIMEGPSPPTVVMCGNDVLAAGAIVRAKALGLRVPEDVSVVGFDDIGIASVVSPALTTVRVPQIEMGRGAARLLVALRDGKKDVSSLQFDAPVIERNSLAPPPGFRTVGAP